MRLSRLAVTIDWWRSRVAPISSARPLPRQDERPAARPGERQGPVAYVMSRFPKLTETFVLNEILAVERLGVRTEIFPLLRERQAVVHPESAPLVRRAHYQPLISFAVVWANLAVLLTQPRAYVSTWWHVLRSAWGSANFFLGALGILPKSIWMAREMRRAGVRHIHAHFANHPAVAALVAHRLTGIPFSFTAHGSDLHVDRRMLDVKVEASAFVVAISQFNKQLIVESCQGRHGDKVHVIHCGVDSAWFSRRDGTARRDRGRAFQVLCVASFEPVKGHRHLVQACEILRRRAVDLTCHLVGDGPLRSAIERQIDAAGLRERFVVHGACTRAQVARLIAGMDAVVLASAPTPNGKREGIPVALMEAMSAGLPVVSTTTGGIPELVESEREGLLVPPGDSAALADAMERLARDPDLDARLGARAREKVLREFDERSSAETLVELFASSGRASVTQGSPAADRRPETVPRREARAS